MLIGQTHVFCQFGAQGLHAVKFHVFGKIVVKFRILHSADGIHHDADGIFCGVIQIQSGIPRGYLDAHAAEFGFDHVTGLFSDELRQSAGFGVFTGKE